MNTAKNRSNLSSDVNQKVVDLTNTRISFPVDNSSRQSVRLGDVRNLDLADDSVDLILTHPPHANIVKYSDGENPADLSSIPNLPKFLDELGLGIQEMFRVLKPNRYCAILIGDTRKAQHYVPLSHFLLQRCLKSGFILKEEIIKTQHNTKYAGRWKGSTGIYGFHLIMHEHLFIFRKPQAGENLSRVRYSTDWQP